MTNKELKKLREDLWNAANKLRAASDLKSNEYSTPVLGLIFLRFAEIKYKQQEDVILAEYSEKKGTRLEEPLHKIAVRRCGLYLPDKARYSYLAQLPASREIDKEVIDAMKSVEKYSDTLKDTLPKNEYFRITRNGQGLLKDLLTKFLDIPDNASGDLLGKIYEFFLEKFGLDEAQKGGEFFTPTSVVSLMVEYIEPYEGKIFDPACGSGGMFVQSNNFIKRHHLQKDSSSPIIVSGQEKTLETVNLARMNLVINGLRGEIKQADTYAEDLYDSYGAFDFVMANPPFNVKEVNEDTVKKDRRFNEYGLPKSKSKTKKDGNKNIPNANYLWINLFATSLNPKGRAALVMANSASDARNSEYDIRKTMVRKGLINAMLSLPSNMFSTVTLPATLWFFDKSNCIADFETEKDKIKILFVDARNVFHQIDRVHREFTKEQVQNLAAIHHLRKGNRAFFTELLNDHFRQAFEQLPLLAGNIGDVESLMRKTISEFRVWTAAFKLSAEQDALVKTEKFFENLQNLSLFKSEVFRDIYKNLQSVREAYLSEINPQQIDKACTIQRRLLEAAESLIRELQQLKKGYEKNFRAFDKLYRFSEKKLKSRDDRAWKELGKPRELRALLDLLAEQSNPLKNKAYQNEEKSFVYFIKQAEWLLERFPEAQYNDVTGLCKLASIAEIEEQDYSLNPGRYVGVVIEDDGMTEEEFAALIKEKNAELLRLNDEAHQLEEKIEKNILELFKNDE